MTVSVWTSGAIRVRNGRGMKSALAKLQRDWCFDGGDIGYDPGKKQVWISAGGQMSYGSSAEFDADLKAFAARWATEPACLDCEFDGEHSELLVGPEGFDEQAFAIEAIDYKIRDLLKQRREALERWLAANPPSSSSDAPTTDDDH